MASLLSQLLHDLRQRYSYLAGELARLKSILPAEALGYRDTIARLAERGLQRIDALLLDPDIHQLKYAKNYYHIYKRLSELVQQLEDGPVLALGRYNDSDRFLTVLTNKICAESGYPYSPPLCTALSTQYYCALVGMDLILVSCSEPFHLLGLSDIYHELGHFILFREERKLMAPLRTVVDGHFARVTKEANQKGWPTASIELIEDHRQSWQRNWLLEFGCDLIATYCCGPAYGWTNVRLCAKVSNDVFQIMSSHPADEARATAIRLMLERIGATPDAARIDGQWQELLLTTGAGKPQEFDLAFPTSLMGELADLMNGLAATLGLAPYPGGNPTGGTIAVALNEAWDTFLRQPALFAGWETSRIAALRQSLGLAK